MIRQASNAKQRDRLRAIELAIAGQSTPTIMQMLGPIMWFCATLVLRLSGSGA
ncbi:MAG: hypothetical protein JKX85_09520 [Phycisphaeraceae bacterium]|nr:hypothetical protein [Phycisphaeraceae bacterium]